MRGGHTYSLHGRAAPAGSLCRGRGCGLTDWGGGGGGMYHFQHCHSTGQSRLLGVGFENDFNVKFVG